MARHQLQSLPLYYMHFDSTPKVVFLSEKSRLEKVAGTKQEGSDTPVIISLGPLGV